MELLHLRRSHIRVFPQDGTVVIAILNAKTAKGLQQSLSPQEDGLVAVLQYLLDRARPRDYLYTSSVPTFRHEFACLVKAVGLAPADYLPYCLRRGGATAFYQRFGLGRTVVQGRWKDQTTARIYVDDARATLIQLLLPAPVAPLQQHLASFWRVAARGLTQSLGKLAIGELALFCTTAALGPVTHLWAKGAFREVVSSYDRDLHQGLAGSTLPPAVKLRLTPTLSPPSLSGKSLRGLRIPTVV